MYTKEPQNEHLEDENVQSSTITETLKADEHEETKETILPETEETKSQIEEKVFCPSLNRAITSGIFVVGAVSPAVVVPSMLRLQEKGYGVEKGIPTLLIAASSLDDIVSISGFNACFSIVFSSGNISNNILSPLRDAGLGVLSGIVLGMFARHFPSSDQVRVQKIIGIAWDIFQPLLFGLVGAEVSVASLKSNAIGVSVGTVSLALLVRISFTFVLMSCAGFNFKEKIFIALSWMPKATVQAVLGPLALEKARMSAPHLESYSKDVMTVAFLSILITAPNGALIIGILGPKLLTRYDTNKVKMELSGSQPH
ncbi:hypothetical protein G4228_011542 [Cervus hanglu yarkandensis]|nr:hypothetical protein G4228_011542 [Cervus hanglu yarkandensis]